MAAMSSGQAKSSAGNKAWFGNVMKSIGGATAASFKSIAPNIANTGAGMYAGGKKVKSSLRPANLISIGRDLSKNKYVKMARKALNQSKQDLRTGKFYNPDRADEVLLGMSGFDMDDFSGFGDEDDEGGDTFVFANDDEGGDAATVALTGAVVQNSETTVSVGNAIIDSNMGISSAVISEIQSGFGEMSKQMETMNATMSAILEFHNSNTTQFYQDMLSTMRAMAPVQKEPSYSMESNPMDIFDSGGSINTSAYKDYIKKRMKTVAARSPVGMLLPFLTDDTMIESMLADPVGGITKSIVSSMIPSIAEQTIKEVDKTFGEFIPNMLLEIGKWANDPSKGMMKQLIGNIFGLHPNSVERNTQMAEVTKDAATFDNVTRNTLVEVLPKYARESTAYLREIALHITKQDNEKGILANSDVFDTKKNRYVKRGDLENEFMQNLMDQIKATFTNTNFGGALQNVGAQLTGKDKKSFDATFDQFVARLATTDMNLSERDYNTKNKKSKINQLLKGLGGKRRDTDLLRQAIQYMYDNNQSIETAARAQQETRNAWNTQMKDMSENYDTYNLHTLGIDNNTDITKLLNDRQAELAAKNKKKGSKRGTFDTITGKQKMTDLVSSSATDWKETLRRRDDTSGGMMANVLFGENFGQGFKEMGGHAVNTMHAIMKGDPRGAMQEFSQIFTSQMKNMWEGAKTHFLQPLGEKLFGKDEDGNAIGLFANVQNKMSDTYKATLQKINGKSYTDSKGEVVEAEPGSSLVDKATEIFSTVKDSVKTVLFGEEGEDGEKKTRGFLGKAKDMFTDGLQGWRDAIFGESDDPEAEIQKVKDSIKENMPGAILGAGGGALLGAVSGGSLLGTLVGGPVGGAVLGFATSFLSKSDKFKDYLFGPEIEDTDEDGNTFKRRVGGLVSANAQKMFKENKNSIIGGAALGTIKAMVFGGPGGLLGTLVGGPIGGALIGAGLSMVKKSDAFQKFLYGDDEAGKDGIITSFKKMFGGGKSGNNEEASKEDMKALGMGVTGAAGGAFSAALIGKVGVLGAMATPLGPLGGAIAGAAVGIAAGSKKFRTFLFGEKDKETGETKKVGLFQKFGNYLHVEMLAPMKSKVLDIVDDMKITLKYDILETVRLPFSIMANHIQESIGNAKEFLSEKVGGAIVAGYEKFVKPIGDIFTKHILDPARKIIGKGVDVMYNFAKATITAPFKLVRHVGKMITSPIRKGLTKLGKMVFGGVRKLFGFAGAVVKTAFSPVSKLAKGLFGGIKNIATGINDRFQSGKEGGGIRGAFYRGMSKLTSSEWRKGDYENQAEKAEAKRQARAEKQKRRITDENRRRIARELGYDVKYFTEENAQAAIASARAKGKDLKLRKGKGGDYGFEEDPKEVAKKERMKKSTAEISKNGDHSDDMEVRLLTEAHRTNERLAELAQILREGNLSAEERAEAEAERDELKQEQQEKVEEAARAGMVYDPETGEVRSADDSNEKRKKKSIKDMMDEWTGKFEDAGGMFNYFKNSMSTRMDSAKDKFNNSWFGKKLGRNQEETDDVEEIFENEDHTRAAGGPVKRGEPYLVGEESPEIVVPDANATVLSQRDGGIKSFITGIDRPALQELQGVISKEDEDQENILTKTLDVLADIAEDVPMIGKALSKAISGGASMLRSSDFNAEVNELGITSALKNHIPFGGARAEGGPVKKDNAYLVGDGGTDPQAEEIFVPKTSGQILSQGKDGIKVELIGVSTGAAKSIKDSVKNANEETEESKSEAHATVAKDQNSYSALKKASDDQKEITSDNAREDKMLETLEEIRDKNSEHHFSWKEIFGNKKGLITLAIAGIGSMLLSKLPIIEGLMSAAKGVFDVIGGAIDGIKTTLDDAAAFFGWNKDNHANEGGKSKTEALQDETAKLGEAGSELKKGHFIKAAGKFVLDGGEYDAQSGSRAKLLAVGAARGTEKIARGYTKTKKFAGNVASKGRKVVSGVKKAAGVAKQSGRAISNIARGGGIKGAYKAAGKELAEEAGAAAWEATTRNAAGKVALESAESVADAGSKGLLSKVTGMLKTFMETVGKKLSSKYPAAGKAVAAFMKGSKWAKAMGALAKNIGKAAAKITAVLSAKATIAGVTLSIGEWVGIGLGAINGASGAGRLFQVSPDKVDPLMIAIATVMGGFTGSTIGAVVDVVASFIESWCQYNFLNTFACAIYGALAGKDKAENLNQLKEDFRGDFDKMTNEEVQKQYNTQLKLGIIDPSMNFEQFKAGLSEGTTKAAYKSFSDYNAEQNKTIGYRMGKGITNIGKGIGKWWNGKDTYTDDKGNTYEDIGNKKFMVRDKDGNEIGEVAKEAVDTSTMQKSTKGGTIKKGIVGAAKAVGGGLKAAGKGVVGVAKKVGGGIAGVAKNIGKGVGDVASGALDIGKSLFNNEVKLKQYMIKGDVSGLMQHKAEVDDKTPLAGVVKAAMTGGKFLNFPPTAISWVGHKVWDGISGFVKGIGDIATTLGSNIKNIFGFAPAADFHGLSRYKVQVNDDMPMSGFVKGILYGSKFVALVPTGISWVGHKIWDGVKPLIEGVKQVASSMGTNIASIGQFALKGDIQGLSNFTPQIDEGTPLAGVLKGVVTGAKFVNYIPAAVSWVGRKVATGVKSLIGGVKQVASVAGTNAAQLTQFVQHGDLEGLGNYEPGIPEDTPLSGIVKGVFTGAKFVNYIPTAISWVGHKVANGVVGLINGVKNVASVAASNTGQLAEFAKSGDLEGLGGYEPEIPEDTPLSGIVKGVFTGAKFVNYIPTSISWVGHKVAEGVVGMIDGIKTIASTAANETAKLATFAKEGDLDGLGDYEPGIPEDTPLSGIVKGVFTGAKFVNYIPTAISWVGHKVADTVSGLVSSVVGGVTDIGSYASSLWKYSDTKVSMDGFDKESMGDGMLAKIASPVIRFIMKPIVQVKRVFSMIGDWVKDKIGKIGDFFGGLFDSAKKFATGDYDDVDKKKYGGNGLGRKPRRIAYGGRGEIENNFTYYSQEDPAWANEPYVSAGAQDGGTMADTGCAPTAMAMVASEVAKRNGVENKGATPTELANLASRFGFRDDTGTNEQFISYAGTSLGISPAEMMQPSAEDIQYNAMCGEPMILNGISNGESGSAFTNAGHYVVVAGTDSSGNILVNDPRGKQYSRAYKPQELANQTRKAWSFGGSGPMYRFGKQWGKKGGKMGGRGVSGDWLSIVRSVKALVAEQKPTYNQGGSMTINYNGQSITLRPDCSGLVGCMLQIYGAIPPGTNVTSRSLLSDGAIPEGFTKGGWPGWEGLQEGDIISRSGHVEIFANNNGGHNVYNGGSTSALGSPGPTPTGHANGYDVVWRPGNAGTGSGAVTSGGATAGGTTSSGSSSGGFTDTISKAGNIFTKFASKAMQGMLTGNWDFDFSDKDESSSATGGATSGGIAVNVDPSKEKESVWKFFRQTMGYTPEATAAVMGNMEQESGVHAVRVQGDFSSGYQKSQEYTQQADAGGPFVGDKKGYGLIQFTYSKLKEELLNSAKSQGKSVGDLGVQLGVIKNSLEGSGVLGNELVGMNNSFKSNTDMLDATKQWLNIYEKPGGDRNAEANKRLGFAQAIYNQYKGLDGGSSGGNYGTNGGFGGRGIGKLIHRVGGRSGTDAMVPDTTYGRLYDETSKPVSTQTVIPQNIDTESLERLMTTVIKVLQSIDSNTSKIEGLNVSNANVNNGGNVTVVNGGNTVQQAPPVQRDSPNASLAQMIARG